MQEQAAQPRQHINNKAHRHKAAENFVGKQIEVFKSHNDIELALAVLSRAKLVGEFPRFQRTPNRKNHVQKDLESLARHLTDGLLKHLAPDGKKSTHRVGEFGFAGQRT